VLGIGDSVMQGAKAALLATVSGIAVDAAKSRQFGEAINVVTQYKNLLALPNVIVIHLGTNGRISGDQFDQMMRTIGTGRRVYFLTARVPRLWESEVNATLHAGATRWPNSKVLEWRDYSGCHDDWFVDGFHLRTPGQQAYAAFIRDGILGKAPTTCTK
jgi:lysophospholipase L1-like esterase